MAGCSVREANEEVWSKVDQQATKVVVMEVRRAVRLHVKLWQSPLEHCRSGVPLAQVGSLKDFH